MSAIASGLADGKSVPFPFAESAVSWLANATDLKAKGTEAFKSNRYASAVDFYAEAARAAAAARKQEAGGAASSSSTDALLASLHANTAMCHLKLERWTDVVASATAACQSPRPRVSLATARIPSDSARWRGSADRRSERRWLRRRLRLGSATRSCASAAAELPLGR